MGKFCYMYICTISAGEVFNHQFKYCGHIIAMFRFKRRSRVTKVLDMINRAGGGGPLLQYRSFSGAAPPSPALCCSLLPVSSTRTYD